MQATVIGASILSDNPSEYTTKAFAISGSCKREDVKDQQKLLQLAVNSLRAGPEPRKRASCMNTICESITWLLMVIPAVDVL
jgi:hypothetical protein